MALRHIKGKMMAYLPAQQLSTPYEDYPGYFLKCFTQGTTTPLPMATDSTGGTLLAKAEVSSGGAVQLGFIKTAGNVIFQPYLNAAYDAWLFPTASEADVNDTSNAIKIADNVDLQASEKELSSLFNKVFDTVALMVSDTGLSVGESVKTLGYLEKGDGGNNQYDIVAAATGTDDGGSFLDLSAHQARALFNSDSYRPDQWGATGDGVVDDSPAVQAALDFIPAGSSLVFISGKTYFLSSVGVTSASKVHLTGGGTIKTSSNYNIGVALSGAASTISNLSFTVTGQTTLSETMISIDADNCLAHNIDFIGNGKESPFFGRGQAIRFGIGVNDPDHLMITNCRFKNFEYSVYGNTSRNVVVSDCYFTGGIDPTYAAANYGTSSLGDGIKLSLFISDDSGPTDTTYTGVTGFICEGCVFEDMERDGLDLFFKGSSGVISGNIFKGDFNKCVDIKVIYAASTTSIPDVRQTRSVSVIGNQFLELNPINYALEVLTTTTSIPLTEDNSAQAIIIDSNVFDTILAPILNIQNSSFVSFTNNIVRKFDAESNNEYVIVFEGSSAPAMRQINISGNQIRIADDAIDLGFVFCPSGVTDIEHLTISNNTYYGGDDDNTISLNGDGVNNLVMIGNTFQGNIDTSATFGSHHLLISDLDVGVISSNIFQWCNLEAMRINGADNVRITNNVIGNAGQTSVRKEIRIEDGTNIASTGNVIVSDNTLHDNGLTTEGVTNGATGANIVINNNSGLNPIGASAVTVSASPFTYTAGTSDETVYIYSGTVSNVSQGGETISTATGVQVFVAANTDIIVTFTSTPTIKKYQH